MCVCLPCVIKESKQRRPGGRRVMQSKEAKERTQGRQEGREGREEGGIVASGDPALQECADGHVPHSLGPTIIFLVQTGRSHCRLEARIHSRSSSKVLFWVRATQCSQAPTQARWVR
ncbi:hypothetical protein FQN60_015911 [Etheostoma spectabile]|uniref:Uncharacterized protein n=1 Tax=Etheostoma spectabile TaxID=54343 RepID=A0A5J5CS44_9PERO|nr:hypothetical protein FQN60_015911 [Etheostoma spectabile]